MWGGCIPPLLFPSTFPFPTFFPSFSPLPFCQSSSSLFLPLLCQSLLSLSLSVSYLSSPPYLSTCTVLSISPPSFFCPPFYTNCPLLFSVNLHHLNFHFPFSGNPLLFPPSFLSVSPPPSLFLFSLYFTSYDVWMLLEARSNSFVLEPRAFSRCHCSHLQRK